MNEDEYNKCEPMDRLCLKGVRTTGDHELRISFLSTILNNAEAKMNHIDRLRQTNMNIALVIFAGMCGFGFHTVSPSFRQPSFIALTFVMFIFSLLDRRYHRFQHGWRTTQRQTAFFLVLAINKPQDDLNVERYYPEGEGDAEPFALQPVLYYMLTTAALCLSVLFAFRRF